MNNSIRFSLALVTLLGLASQTIAQRFQGSNDLNLLQRPSNAEARITDDDHPSICYDFLWNGAVASWDSSGMETFTYFPNGQIAEEVNASFTGSGFVNSDRNTYIQNSQGLDSISSYYVWQVSAWENTNQNHNWYDPYGNTTLQYYLLWNGTGFDTTSGYRYNYVYHSSNQPLEYTTEDYNIGSSTWQLVEKYTYTFNTQDQIDSETGYYWTGSAWVPDYRAIDVIWFSYPDLLTYALVQVYNTGTWDDETRLSGVFSSGSEIWTYEDWTGSAWEYSDREIIRQDQMDHETYYCYQTWDNLGQTWENAFVDSVQFSYNGNGQLVDEIRLSWQGGSTYVNDWRRTCSSFFTSAPSPHLGEIKVKAYPNPVTDVLYFDLGDGKPGPVAIGLYDLQGRLRVAVKAPQRGAVIPVEISETLEAGTYFYHVQTREGAATGKVVIAH